MSWKVSKGTGILVLFFLFLGPSLFYMILSKGKHNFALPILGSKVANPENPTDTTYHTIGNFNFTNHEGNSVSLDDVNETIYIVDYFFTTCKTICPEMTSQMERVNKHIKDYYDTRILSHTVNPENDSVAVLKEYALKHNAVAGKWDFLTGNKKELYDLARNSYFLDARDGDGGPDDFIHSDRFLLIDKEGRLRGIYNGTDQKEVDKLLDEIDVLRYEYNIPVKDKTKPKW